MIEPGDLDFSDYFVMDGVSEHAKPVADKLRLGFMVRLQEQLAGFPELAFRFVSDCGIEIRYAGQSVLVGRQDDLRFYVENYEDFLTADDLAVLDILLDVLDDVGRVFEERLSHEYH